MRESAGRRRCGTAGGAVALTLALVLGGGTAAFAATPTAGPSASATPTPPPTGTAGARSTTKPKAPVIHYPTLDELLAAQRSEKAQAAEVTSIGEQVIALQHQADAAAGPPRSPTSGT